jgi:hypothetical protein
MEILYGLFTLLLEIILFIFIYILLKLLLSFWHKFSLKNFLYDCRFWFSDFFIMSWVILWFFNDVITPYFAWSWNRFYPYLISNLLSINDIENYIIWWILSFIIVPTILSFIKKKIFINKWLEIEKYFLLKNVIILDLSYIIYLFISYYIGLEKYHYFIM